MGSTEHSSTMAARALEGDWEFISDKGYDPVKVSVKNIIGSDWIVACMIPKGNMMASMLKREEGGKFTLIKLNCSNRECPKENKDLEDELKYFLKREFLTYQDKVILWW